MHVHVLLQKLPCLIVFGRDLVLCVRSGISDKNLIALAIFTVLSSSYGKIKPRMYISNCHFCSVVVQYILDIKVGITKYNLMLFFWT